MALGVVVGEDVFAEVSIEVTPDGMDMVGLVLGVVEFDEEF